MKKAKTKKQPRKSIGANAVRLAAAAIGSEAKLAKALGIRQQAVNQWVNRGTVPAYRAAMVEKLTGIPKGLLNPLFR